MPRLAQSIAAMLVVSLALPTFAQQPQPQASPSSLPPQTAPTVPLPTSKSQPDTSATKTVNSIDVKTGHAIAPLSQLPAIVPGNRKVIGIALEGGGALGLAHIGVLKWFEENHIPIDRLSGTSMGALIGGLYASGVSPAEIQKIAETKAFMSVFTLQTPYQELSYRRREDRRDLPQAITLGLKGGPSFRNSIMSQAGLNAFLRDKLNSYNREALSYDTLPIPFRCVATDLNTLLPVVFDGGPMPVAVRASIAIPGIFSPVEYRGHYLVDGGIMDNLPTDIARVDLHSDVVIGVQLKSTAFPSGDIDSIVGVLQRAFSAGIASNERLGMQRADILLQVDITKFSANDYGRADELIDVGYKAAAAMGDKLRKYALNDADWRAYLADRDSRARQKPGNLQFVKVEGGTVDADVVVKHDLQPLTGQPITAPAVTNALADVQSNGTYHAEFETFRQDAITSQGPVDRTQAQGPDDGIAIKLSKIRNGPPFLMFGTDIAAANSNVTRTTFDFRLLDTNLGGYGSELRTDLRLGFLTQASTEYYRQLTRSGFFVQPNLGLLRQPVYLWQDQKRISEHLEQQAGGGIDIGRTFSRYAQLSAEYRSQTVRWHPVTGFDGTFPVSGTAQTAVLHFASDSNISGMVATGGLRTNIKVGSLFNTVGSANAPMLESQIDKSFQVSPQGNLLFSLMANSYFRRDVTQPLRFTVGGPLLLSASSIDEWRGTDIGLLRAGYTHKIATLPDGYGHGVYAAFGYEGASIWSPEQHSILRQDGVVTLLGVTPIGSLTIGGAVGDAGHRKIFFSYGRLF